MADGPVVSSAADHYPWLPDDPALPGMPRLFDPAWYAPLFSRLYPDAEFSPDAIAPRQLTYRPGQRALVAYIAEQREDDWIIEHEFAAELLAGSEEPRVWRYPDDPYLPGLARAESAIEGEALLKRNVGLRTDALRVRLVRYRPSTRAVIAYTARVQPGRGGMLTLYARAMRPDAMERFTAAGMLADRSRFHVPTLAGQWREGGVVWLGAMPGETVRDRILGDAAPPPSSILDCLESLWALEPPDGAPVSSLPAAMRFTERFLSQILQGSPAMTTLDEIVAALAPLTAGWQPAGVAHNDFYDDQLIVLPSGELGLVDFEECGLGDRMIDIANMLAHLRWSGHFLGSAPSRIFREHFRAASLSRFAWDERDLDLREAYCLLRLCTNPVRGLYADWREVTAQALLLARSALPRYAAADHAA